MKSDFIHSWHDHNTYLIIYCGFDVIRHKAMCIPTHYRKMTKLYNSPIEICSGMCSCMYKYFNVLKNYC